MGESVSKPWLQGFVQRCFAFRRHHAGSVACLLEDGQVGMRRGDDGGSKVPHVQSTKSRSKLRLNAFIAEHFEEHNRST